MAHAIFNGSRFAGAVDDGGVFLVDLDLLGGAQVVNGGFFERQAHVFGDDGAAGENGDVLEHFLAAVTKARRLDGSDLEDAAQVVDHQGGQRFAFDVFGNDQQRLAGLGNGFEHGQQFADVGDLLLADEDQRVFQLDLLVLLVVDEVGRQVATVELHAFDHVQLVFEAGTVFNGDHAFLANLVHRGGDDFADGFIGVRRHGADLGNGLAVFAGHGQLLDFGGDGFDGLVDAALDVHRVNAGGDALLAFVEDGLGQNGRGGGAVAGGVGGLGSDFLHELGAHVLELVLQFDFLRNRHAVLGDGGGAKALVDDHVTTLGAEGDFDRVGKRVDAGHHACAGVVAKLDFFC